MIAECKSYWQNITCTGRIWLILAEHDLCWQNLTSIGRISLLPAEYDFHWQNMIYTGLLSLLLAEYAANQKYSVVLLCSADSICPVVVVNRNQPIWAEYQSCRCNTCRDWCKSKVKSIQVKCQPEVKTCPSTGLESQSTRSIEITSTGIILRASTQLLDCRKYN